MNYEKIIVELLSRIQTLEEQVAHLISEKEVTKKGGGPKMTTAEIREYIETLKGDAKKAGKSTLILIARDIHKDLNLKDRYPIVCNAMRQCMGTNDIILFQPPKLQSSTLKIEYKL